MGLTINLEDVQLNSGAFNFSGNNFEIDYTHFHIEEDYFLELALCAP